MKRLAPVVTLALCLAFLLAAGCPKPQGDEGQPAGATAATTTTTAPAAADGLYDPKTDPLVNPPSLFEPAPSDASQIALDDTLYRNVDGNPASLNPIFASSTYEFYLGDVLFSGLFSFDAAMNWTINHDVVESFEEADDHVTFTTKMKDGMTWQDGEPFEADDVCFSWDAILDDSVPCPAVKSGTDEIVKCEVLDRLTVRMTSKQPLPTNKWNIQFPIIPKHIYEKERKEHPDLNSGEFYNKNNRMPVGNGPYKIVDWVENDKIVVERWEGYWGKKPYFKRMVFRIIPDPNILLLTFNKGDVDEMRFLLPQAFATQALPGSDFDKAGGVKLLKPQWDLTYICWNQDGSNPFFGDIRVRKAMTMATDIERMRRDITYNLYDQCHGIYHPDSWMYPKEGIALLPYDLDAAGKLLDEAGWVADPNQEGWRYKTVDGAPRRFKFTMLVATGSIVGQRLAAILQNDLKSIGVEMDTQVLEWATFQEKIRKHQFEAQTAAWGTGTDPDSSKNIWKSDQYDPKGEFGRNYGKFSNARVDELYDLGMKEFDPAKRAEIYGEIAKLVYEDQPYTFLFNRPSLWAIQKRIHGVTTSPRGVFNFDPSVFGWWVRQGEAKVPAMSPP